MNPPSKRAPIAWGLKRVVDVGGAAVGLVALGPALLALGLAIRLDDPGPALFVQTRVGRGGRHFRMLKFRTMRNNAPVRFNSDGSTQVSEADGRVTRLGALLRGGLDELPQLVNVLRGEMSLVGPRPDMPVHAVQYTKREQYKLCMRPGMTSLAAVLGRNRINWKQRIGIDLDYVEHWSLGLDVRVIAATLGMALGIRSQGFEDVTSFHAEETGQKVDP